MNNAWKEIICHLNNSMTSDAIHLFVYRDHSGIKEKLGFPSKTPQPSLITNNHFEDEEFAYSG